MHLSYGVGIEYLGQMAEFMPITDHSLPQMKNVDSKAHLDIHTIHYYYYYYSQMKAIKLFKSLQEGVSVTSS